MSTCAELRRRSAGQPLLWTVFALILCLPVAEADPLQVPDPAQAEAAVKHESRTRLAGDGYSDEEREASLARLEQLKILETVGCYPALDQPESHRVCVFEAIGWQGEPWFMEKAMVREGDGWRALESPLKIACPSPDFAQDELRSLLADDSLQVDGEESDRFGFFAENRTDGAEIPGAPLLRCKYRIQRDGSGRLAVTYVRYEGGKYTIEPEPEIL